MRLARYSSYCTSYSREQKLSILQLFSIITMYKRKKWFHLMGTSGLPCCHNIESDMTRLLFWNKVQLNHNYLEDTVLMAWQSHQITNYFNSYKALHFIENMLKVLLECTLGCAKTWNWSTFSPSSPRRYLKERKSNNILSIAIQNATLHMVSISNLG